MDKKKTIVIMAALWAFVAVQGQEETPTIYTQHFNDSIANIAESFGDQDFQDAIRGLVVALDEQNNPVVNGKKLYNPETWTFLKGKAPGTVNPLLWRQAQLNSVAGLYEVVKGKIYQVRGLDIANITFVRSDKGWVVIDASTSIETAVTAMALIEKYVAKLPVKAVVITHSHVDHFGGVAGILEKAVNRDEQIPVIAPAEYFKNSAYENVLAGIPMRRHGGFMFGSSLPRNQYGFVTSGLGGGLTQYSSTNVLSPATKEINTQGETLTIDGLQLDFIPAPNSEAPSEMLVYIPRYKALQSAEDINHTLHNLLTPRGAKIRNGLLWSKYIDEVIVKYGGEAEVTLGSHHWPVWGQRQVVNFWEKQRDLYRYIHDQTIYLANKGYTPNDISNRIKLPAALDTVSANREYYGTVSFNARSQYELYFGFFDGNPANLNPLPSREEAVKIIEAIGGTQQALRRGQEAYDSGEYRWAATLLNKLVFAQPDEQAARRLLAKTYTQLAYQAESAPWRNFYLMGAKELLDGKPKYLRETDYGRDYSTLTPSLFFDAIATRIDGYRKESFTTTVAVHLNDTNEDIALIFKNGVLNNRTLFSGVEEVSITGNKEDIFRLFAKGVTLQELGNKVTIEGKRAQLDKLLDIIEVPSLDFNIVESN
jgi:alkyl sulfatase BDS1-like metallo-beta-lactamase superfamily hydrolase